MFRYLLLTVLVWCYVASCSQSSKLVQDSDFSSVFTGVRGTYQNTLRVHVSPELPDPSVLAVTFTTYSRPNLPGDSVAMHRVEAEWKYEGDPGWWTIEFTSKPPPKEIYLAYEDENKTDHVATIHAPEPPINLQQPENY